MRQYVFIFLVFFSCLSSISVAGLSKTPSSSIDYNYDHLVKHSQEVVRHLLQSTRKASTHQLLNQVAYYLERTVHAPYLSEGATGEGDWCDTSLTTRGCPHIQQDPVYRTDGFDCYTLVTFVMGLIGSHHLTDFNRSVIEIGYGANRLANHYPKDELSYRNRNHFVSQSFNPINQAHHRLRDVTDQGIFSSQVKSVRAHITLKNWFAQQAHSDRIHRYVRVLPGFDAQAMERKLKDPYYFSEFPDQWVSLSYIPKRFFVKKILLPSGKAYYKPREAVINQLPTPSVVEIVRDPAHWMVGKKPIRDLIGSDLIVSHVGLLYRHTFSKGQTIYQKTSCYFDAKQVKRCHVFPIKCERKEGCPKVMLLEATSAYPNNYVWSYHRGKNRYYCTPNAEKPVGAKALTTCNRVLSTPLGDYLTYRAYDHYSFIEAGSIKGLNIQKILIGGKG